MSLSSLAPTEKTEHLIYSLLPISIATWIASLLNLADPIQILVAIATISSFGTILLYEFTPEQWIINEIIRWRSRSRRSLKEAILIFSVMMQLWNTEPTSQKDWKDDYIEEQAKRQVSISVSSPYVKKRIWRIRASVYLIPSIWFIFNALRNYLDVLLGIPNALNRLPSYASEFLSYLHQNMELIIWLIISLIVVSGFVRHWKLTSNIDQLSRFNHLRKLLTMEKLRKPEYFSDAKEQKSDALGRSMLNYLTLVSELDALVESLTVNDWSSFMDGWDRIYQWVHREIVRFLEDFFAFDLMQPFTDIFRGLRNQKAGNPVNIPEVVRSARSKLGWVCYFLSKCEEYKTQRSLLLNQRIRKLLRKTTNDKETLSLPNFEKNLLVLHKEVCQWTDGQIQDPNPLLKLVSGFSTIKRDGVEAAVMFAIAQLMEITPHHLQGSENGVRFLIEELIPDPLRTKFDPDVITRVILRGFQDGVVAYSVKVEHHELFKKLKQFCPPEMENEWEKALAHYIRKVEKAALKLLLDDTGFLKEPAKNIPRVRSALSDIKHKFKEDRQIVNLFGKYL